MRDRRSEAERYRVDDGIAGAHDGGGDGARADDRNRGPQARGRKAEREAAALGRAEAPAVAIRLCGGVDWSEG